MLGGPNSTLTIDDGSFHLDSNETQKTFKIDASNFTENEMPTKIELYEVVTEGFYLGSNVLAYITPVSKLYSLFHHKQCLD